MKKISLSLSLLVFLILSSAQAEAQTRTTLTQEEKDAINVLFQQELIGISNGGDGWTIDPDIWNGMTFQKRKGFTEKLPIYYKNYTEGGKKMSGFCYFYNMATNKKISSPTFRVTM